MLDDLISPHTLFHLAGDKVFLRGEAYFSEGAVRHLVADATAVTAWVSGTEEYRVELSDDAGDLAWDCDRPHAAGGNFCKHCVAVGLAWLTNKARRDDTIEHDDAWSRIQAYLGQLPHDDLVNLVLEMARRDAGLLQSLSLKSQRDGGKRAAALRQAIDQATSLNPRHGWGHAGDYVSGLERTVAELDDLLDDETAADLLDLLEYAIERVETLLEQVDDDGEFNSVLEDFCQLHREACGLAKLPGETLARRLLDLELAQRFEYCRMDVAGYQDALGEEGIRAYRELAEAAWAESGPGDRRLASLMEQLARLSGDVDALLAVKARDLSSSWRYLDIAQILGEAGRDDEALEWAERGWRADPQNLDNRLRDFLIDVYLKRNRHDEAVQLAWALFEARPWLEHYKKLHQVASKAGVWPEQRQRALTLVEQRAAQAPRPVDAWLPGASTRLEIALWEKDLDTAWKLARQAPCEHHLLIELARQLETRRVDDAIALYKRVIPGFVEQTNNRAYGEAVALVRRVAALLRESKRSPELVDYLITLRGGYKAKRNFMKLLDDVV